MFELCWVRFWTFLKIWFFFRFFFEFFQVSTLQCVLAISFRKKYLKTSSELVWTLLGTISDTLENLKFSIFSIFLLSNLQGALSNNFTEKISSKHVQNIFDCFWGTFLGILKMWKFFQFLELVPSFDIPGCTAHFFRRKLPQNKFKACLDTFRNVFVHFWNFKTPIFFSFFSIFRPCRHDDFRKNHLVTCLNTWVRFWTFLKICFFFDLYLNFFKSRPSSVN